MSRVLAFATERERAAALPDVVAHLRTGGIIGYPTETVYGLGCALLPDALATLASAKRPGGHRPFLLLVPASWSGGLEWTDEARRLAKAFWPGPLTIALTAPPGRFPGEVTSEDGTVAVRNSPHAGVDAIVRALGAPITSTSANVPGEAPALDAAGAADAADRLGLGAVSLVLDGGRLEPAAPSTLVSASPDRVRIVRTGSIPDDDLRRVLRDYHGE